MNKSKQIKSLLSEINQYAGSTRGNEAKTKYEMIKLEGERRRNVYTFINMLLLSIIAIVNLLFAILKYFQDK